MIYSTGAKIIIEGFNCLKLGSIPKTEIDLTPYAGQYVRVWLDQDGSYSLDPATDHYWQMAEMNIPDLQETDTGEIDEEGAPIMEVLPLDLSDMVIAVWELPT